MERIRPEALRDGVINKTIIIVFVLNDKNKHRQPEIKSQLNFNGLSSQNVYFDTSLEKERFKNNLM